MRVNTIAASIVFGLVFALSACGGELADEIQPPGAANRDRTDDADRGDSPPGRPPAPECDVEQMGPTHACVRPLRAAVPLELYVEDDGCYSGGCEGMTRDVSCAVLVEGETIFLDLVVQTCTDGQEGPKTCTSDCRSLGVKCKLPALAAGSYHVIGRAAPWSGGKRLDRTLDILDDAKDETCLDASDAALGK